MILSRGDKLVLDDLALTYEPAQDISPTISEAITEQDYRHLRYQTTIDALRQTKGKLYGDDGAASLLGIKPTTLASRMKKMGISRNTFA